MGTLDIDLLLVEGEVHGVESTHLAHCIADRGILQRGGDCKVLQLIKYEIEFIVILGIINPYQCLTERGVLKVVSQSLCLTTDSEKAQDEYIKQSHDDSVLFDGDNFFVESQVYFLEVIDFVDNLLQCVVSFPLQEEPETAGFLILKHHLHTIAISNTLHDLS